MKIQKSNLHAKVNDFDRLNSGEEREKGNKKGIIDLGNKQFFEEKLTILAWKEKMCTCHEVA